MLLTKLMCFYFNESNNFYVQINDIYFCYWRYAWVYIV